VAFVNDHEIVIGKVIQEAERSGTGEPSVKEAGVVFDAAAISEFFDHFEIEGRAFVDTAGFEEFSFAFEIFFLAVEFVFDFANNMVDAFPGCDVEVSGKDSGYLHAFDAFATFYFDLFDFLDFIAEESDAVAEVHIRKVDINGIAPDAEGSAAEVGFGAGVETFHEPEQETVPGNGLTFTDPDDPGFVVFRVAHTIDTGDRGNDNHVSSSREQGGGSPQTKFIHFFVDGEVFFDISIGNGDISFRLVVIVIGDEVFYCIIGEKLTKLAV